MVKDERYCYNLLLKVSKASEPIRKERGYITTNNKIRILTTPLLLKESEAFFYEILFNTHDALIVVDINTQRVVYVNGACEKMYGYMQDELLGMPITLFCAVNEDMLTNYFLKVARTYPRDYYSKAKHIHKNGNLFAVKIISKIILMNNRRYVLAQVKDITRHQEKKIQLKKLLYRLSCRAYRDYLTGTYNRHYLFDVYLGRITKLNIGLLLLDIDDFKQINDCYGHQAGDLVLIEVGYLIHRHIRPGDRVIRFGGDEFLIILPDRSETEVTLAAQTIRNCISNWKFCHGEQKMNCSVSIGSAIGRLEHAGQMDEMIKQADSKLYSCKRAGKCSHE